MFEGRVLGNKDGVACTYSDETCTFSGSMQRLFLMLDAVKSGVSILKYYCCTLDKIPLFNIIPSEVVGHSACSAL